MRVKPSVCAYFFGVGRMGKTGIEPVRLAAHDPKSEGRLLQVWKGVFLGAFSLRNHPSQWHLWR